MASQRDGGIAWCDETWNPIRGCSLVSAGCTNCYAMGVAARFSGPGLAYEGLARRRSNGKPQWTGEVRVIESHMNDPIRWRTPRRIFVNSMSDLFHESVSDETIDRVFAVMAQTERHTFQILTKRPDRMLRYVAEVAALPARVRSLRFAHSMYAKHPMRETVIQNLRVENCGKLTWPLPNVWLGVSTENQETADERIPLLLQTPAAVRFISAEPLLGPLDISLYLEEEGYIDDQYVAPLDWVIVGGESGRDARDCDVTWIRRLVADCNQNGQAVFVKQLGRHPTTPDLTHWRCPAKLLDDSSGYALTLRDSHGGDISEWPEDLRIREFPTPSPLATAQFTPSVIPTASPERADP